MSTTLLHNSGEVSEENFGVYEVRITEVQVTRSEFAYISRFRPTTHITICKSVSET